VIPLKSERGSYELRTGGARRATGKEPERGGGDYLRHGGRQGSSTIDWDGMLSFRRREITGVAEKSAAWCGGARQAVFYDYDTPNMHSLQNSTSKSGFSVIGSLV
jgi:hypothetical protein